VDEQANPSRSGMKEVPVGRCGVVTIFGFSDEDFQRLKQQTVCEGKVPRNQ
jgi:hypothetical protein